MDECKVAPECSINTIDESNARLNSRLYNLLDNIRAATFGEQPTSESSDKESIPTPSLESIDTRLRDAHGYLDSLESIMKRFHA